MTNICMLYVYYLLQCFWCFVNVLLLFLGSAYFHWKEILTVRCMIVLDHCKIHAQSQQRIQTKQFNQSTSIVSDTIYICCCFVLVLFNLVLVFQLWQKVLIPNNLVMYSVCRQYNSGVIPQRSLYKLFYHVVCELF